MTIRTMPRTFTGRLLALVALAAAALLLATAFGTTAAHADEPDPQAIIVGQQVSISTSQSWYRVGNYMTFCYTVPAPGFIQITDQQGGSVKTLLSGYDDGAGDCIGGYVTPPLGKECLTIRYYFPQGGSTTAKTCFQVLPQFVKI
jgi:hypothetical protein